MYPQPLICARDVEASSRWYQLVLGCESGHGGPNYERLVDSGRLIMQLHRWEEEHHHGAIGDPNDKPPGNGLLLWFEVDDFDAAVARAERARGRNHFAAPSESARWEWWAESLGDLVTRSGWVQGRAGESGWDG